MLAALEDLNSGSASGVHTRIRCICHILNLIVKVGLDIKVTIPHLSHVDNVCLGNLITILSQTKVGELTRVGQR
jgi:hypothetical protein